MIRQSGSQAPLRLRPSLLHIVGDSKYGGGSVLIARLSEAARSAGWDVSVLTTDDRFAAELHQIGIAVVPLNVIWRPVNPVKDLIGTARLYRYLKSASFDVIHTHTSKGGFVGRLAAYLAGNARVIHTVHGFAFHDFSSALSFKATASMERLAARWCDRIVTVSKFHKDLALWLSVAAPEKIVAIPNGIQPHRLITQSSREDVRTGLRVSPEQALLVGIGRLTAQKGFDLAIIALAQIRQRGHDAVLAIAGEGEHRAHLEALARRHGVEDHVRLLGFRDDLGELLSAADLVVLPSVREGLSLALLEAMAAAKPIIATQIGSNIEATGEGHCALLIPPLSVTALVESIEQLLSDPDLCRTLAARAEARFNAHYTEDAMLQGYLSEYRHLLKVTDTYGRTPYTTDVQR